MDYFWLDQDKRMANGVLISQFNQILGRRAVLDGDFRTLQHINVAFASENPYNWFPDVLSKQLFMITKPIYSVLKLYLEDLSYKAFCILDNPNDMYQYYYIPLLQYFDCLSPHSEGSRDKSSFSKVILKKELLPPQPAFMIKGINMQMTIINLEIAESILRRQPKGIRIHPVMID